MPTQMESKFIQQQVVDFNNPILASLTNNLSRIDIREEGCRALLWVLLASLLSPLLALLAASPRNRFVSVIIFFTLT